MPRRATPYGLEQWLAYEREHPASPPVTHRCEVCGRSYFCEGCGRSYFAPRQGQEARCIDSRCPGGRIVPVGPDGRPLPAPEGP
jgi:hypothetical protein